MLVKIRTKKQGYGRGTYQNAAQSEIEHITDWSKYREGQEVRNPQGKVFAKFSGQIFESIILNDINNS